MSRGKAWERPELQHLTDLECRCAALWFKIDPATVAGPPTGLIVGEMPGCSTSSALPMFPYPPNSAGGRLLKMSLLTPGAYLGRLMRTNLFSDWNEETNDRWPRGEAEERARLIHEATPREMRVVLLGARVSQAFGLDEYMKLVEQNGVLYTAIPHPSGRNLKYNDPIVRTGARAALQWAADSIAEGTPTAKQIKRGKR